MKRNHLYAWGAVLGAAGILAMSPPAQGFAPLAELYSGAPAAQNGMRLSGWGSGRAIEDRMAGSAGANSIKLETDGYFAGGRIVFDTPRDITEQKADPNGFLEFVMRFQPGRPKMNRTLGGSSDGYGGSSMGNSGGSSYPPGYGGSSGDMSSGGQQALGPDTTKLKVQLICEEGQFIATNFPLRLTIPARTEGWFSVAIPFVAFKGLNKVDTARVKEIRFFGDTKDTFWIGEIRTTTDDEPITVDELDEQEVAVGDFVEFTVEATAGLSTLHYSWDFDAKNGIQEDATGPSVVHVYRNAGPNSTPVTYDVTLTVTDVSGAKKSEVKRTKVVVNP